MRMSSLCFSFVCGVVCLSGSAVARADLYSPNQAGTIGLNTMPNARISGKDQVWAGGSFSDPYAHGFIGFNLSDRLDVTLRQSAEISGAEQDPKRLYPGIDFKVKALSERRNRPQVAIGAQGAWGHKRMAGEYIALSRRYKGFDFTAGAGWGRFGSALHVDNPLAYLGDHFSQDRALDGEEQNGPSDWFTGKEIGLFGGVEYFTPYKGLSVKADIGADRAMAEKVAFDFKPAAPWSLGVNYKQTLRNMAQIDWGVAAQGFDRIMARISISQMMSKLGKRPRTPSADFYQTTADQAVLHYQNHYSLPAQIGAASAHIDKQKQSQITRFLPANLGLRGPEMTIVNGDMTRAQNGGGSSAEAWRNVSINAQANRYPNHDRGRGKTAPLSLILDSQISLAEDEYIALQRTSVLAQMRAPFKMLFMDVGGGLRLNLSDNLHELEKHSAPPPYYVRGDVYNYTGALLALDNLYASYGHSFQNDVHVLATAGYLEEMFAGAGLQILHRPFGERLAVGAEGFMTYKRDSQSDLNLDVHRGATLSGRLSTYYDLPRSDMTIKTSFGSNLDTLWGSQAGLIKRFDNGATLEGFITISDVGDMDLFGGETTPDHGVRLTLPLGGVKGIPDYASARLSVQPFGRNRDQFVNKPQDLYDMTTPLSLAHITKNWHDVAVNAE